MANLPTRNNNPGDLKNPSTGGFERFGNPSQGFAALKADLQGKMTGNTKTGLGPNSSLRDLAYVWAPPSDRNNSEQYAHTLAAHLGTTPDAPLASLNVDNLASAVAGAEGYQGPSTGGTKMSVQSFAEKIKAKYPQYANVDDSTLTQKILDKYPQYQSSVESGQPNSQTDDSNGFPGTSLQIPDNVNSQDQSQHPGFFQGLSEDLTGTNPESLGTQLGNTAKGAGNFLFPIVGDVYHDGKGDSTKTGLQQLGDAGLSALPFIPGLGEVGEGARGAGLLAKVAGSSIAKGALTGYGAGVAGNLSQGKGLGESFAPNFNTIAGTLTGGVAPALMKGLGAVVERAAGVSPELKNALMQEGGQDTGLLKHYQDVTARRAQNITAPSAQNAAVDELEKAAQTLEQKASAAGEAVGNAKDAAVALPMGDVSSVIKEFQDRVARDYGLALSLGQDGSIRAETIPGRVSKLSTADANRLTEAFQKINSLSGESAQKASDVIGALRLSVDYNKAGQIGHTFDPIEGLLSNTATKINGVMRQAAPGLAAANDRFSHLSGLVGEVKKMAGGDLQRGELLMRRIFSGDKGVDVTKLFKDIEAETGENLVKHAVFAKAATDTMGSANDKTLFEKAIEGAAQAHAQAHAGNLITPLINAGTGLLRSSIANPARITRDIVSGKDNGLLKNLVTKSAVRGATSVAPLIGQ